MKKVESAGCSVMSNSGIFQARILEWVAILLFQGTFPIQELNPGILHQRHIIYSLRHQGSLKETEKAGLKLNIKKNNIMASNPIAPWKREGGKVEAVTDFIFLGSKNHCGL